MDSILVKKAIDGDADALSLLIDKYKNYAYNLAVSIVKNREYARDITQESFLKVLENISRFKNESKFSTWLYRIVYNESLKHNLEIKKTSQTSIESVDTAIYSEDKSSPENENLDEKLYQAIEKLENNERITVTLFYLGDKSIKEINIITGLSKPNIKVILHRARKKLFEYLKPEYETT